MSSAVKPALRIPPINPIASAIRASSSTTIMRSAGCLLPRPHQHRQPLDPRSPADRRRRCSAEALHQPIIAPAAQHRALRPSRSRALPSSRMLERGVAVIVQPAHQPRTAAPMHARRIQPAGHGLEEAPGLVGRYASISGALGQAAAGRAGPCCPKSAADSAPAAPAGCPPTASPRCASKCATNAARHASRVSASPSVLSCSVTPPRSPARAAAGRPTPAARRPPRFARADHLGVDLVKLAVAALLRAFVAEHRAVRRHLQRRILLPAVGDESARDPGGEFGAQGQESPPRSANVTSPSTPRPTSHPWIARRPRSPRTPESRRGRKQ